MSRESSFSDQKFHGVTTTPSFTLNEVFVMMSFDEKHKDAYSAIVDECKKIGLNAKRVDEVAGSGLILENITDNIEDAEFLIADLTDEKPNVYYELGYAHGVGNGPNDILLIAKEGTNLHFNVASLAVRFYSSTEHLRKIVNEHLKKMIDMR